MIIMLRIKRKNFQEVYMQLDIIDCTLRIVFSLEILKCTKLLYKFVDVDECASGPCSNGGQCVNDVKQYFCLCQADWTGLNCDRSKKIS